MLFRSWFSEGVVQNSLVAELLLSNTMFRPGSHGVMIGRAGFGAAVEVGLDEGELGAVGIVTIWEMLVGGAIGLDRGLEREEETVVKGEMGVEEGGET